MSTDTIVSPFQKLWSFGNESIVALFVHLPGRVFINYNSSSNSSVDVTVSSDSKALLDLVHAEVVNRSLESSNVVHGEFTPVNGKHPVLNLTTLNPTEVTQGNLLITLSVNSPVTMLSTMADTVLNEGSLISNNASATVRLQSLKSGSIYYSIDNTLQANVLDLTSHGDSSIQVVAPRIDVGTIWKITTYSNSAIGVVAPEASTTELDSLAFDESAIYLQSDKSLTIEQSQTEAFSNGAINYYPQGTCGNSDVSAYNFGVVNIASLICQNTSAHVFFNGIVNVQTTDTLEANTIDDGQVNYFNSTPLHLPQDSDSFFHLKTNLAKVDVNTYNKWTLRTAPAQEPLYVTIAPEEIEFSSFEATPSSNYGGTIAAFVIAILGFLVYIKRTKRVQYESIP
ncbi:hypothetical protein THRCLA_20504 [Thraustotheca clavata]|uniref:Uncharacterized protein n=1 Tax=Thraustotheca clavata TaxID=74557 RepID=A0A1W0A6G1_9STRA|nr:hypothetical protein THRCLA_20504 [Thraustotheca clavata]